MRTVLVGLTALALALSSLTFAAEEAKAPSKEKATKEAKATDEMKPVKEDKASTGELKTFSQKLSYAVGMDVGASLKELKKELDLDIFFRGLRDSLEEKKSLLTEQETAEIKKEFVAKMQTQRAEKNKTAGEKNLKEGVAYLEENKKKKGVITTPSGLQYEVLKEGDGAKPKATDTVSVHYRGTLIDGTEFDSSYKRNEPAVFPVTGVIPGWTEALLLMKVGGKYRLVIPSELAYKDKAPGPIGPNAVLIFEVELLKVEKEEGGPPAALPKL
jgi:FKBP-type peptidyl-prolyl cis-trans isomerase FkpA/FKBP-type peptidyl-prolyl cis-trans isomerase FklB